MVFKNSNSRSAFLGHTVVRIFPDLLGLFIGIIDFGSAHQKIILQFGVGAGGLDQSQAGTINDDFSTWEFLAPSS